MKRVNKTTSYVPSLLNQSPGQQINIKGAKPLGITFEKGTGDLIKNGALAGSLAFGVNGIYRLRVKDGGGRIPWKKASLGGVLAVAAGMAPTLLQIQSLNKSIFSTPIAWGNFPLATAPIVAGGSFGTLSGYVGKKRNSTIKSRDEIKYGVATALPVSAAALLGGSEGIVQSIVPYFASLTGVYLSSKYIVGTRS
ncbi:MAG: hypothetical protein CMA60_00220 [Euryarchaeota archaeon]|nr:hypothetical protein [Euryarchaeota archaeon]|tara:strand:- start:7048 stop:7632 length:585 start_codon:yes stop_codon:yes gene_type:complete